MRVRCVCITPERFVCMRSATQKVRPKAPKGSPKDEDSTSYSRGVGEKVVHKIQQYVGKSIIIVICKFTSTTTTIITKSISSSYNFQQIYQIANNFNL